MRLSPKRLIGLMLSLDWRGHVELPDGDISWLARELAASLDSSKKGTCEACHEERVIIVVTPLGDICEGCIEQFGRMAEGDRRELE